MILMLIQYIYENLINNFFEIILSNIKYFLQINLNDLNNLFNGTYQVKNNFFEEFDYDSIENPRRYIDYVYEEIFMEKNANKYYREHRYGRNQAIDAEWQIYIKYTLRVSEEYLKSISHNYIYNPKGEYIYDFDYYYDLHKRLFIWKETGIFILEDDYYDFLKYKTVGIILLIASCIGFRVYGFLG